MKLSKPTLLIHERRAKRNIKRMVEKLKDTEVSFRPHFKTHQSIPIGEWFREYGVEGITVSSVDMAIYFANGGWNDITIAIPINPLQIDGINNLASKITLGVLVESVDAANYLIKNIINPVNVWIEIDQGYHRTGVEKYEKIFKIAKILQKNANLVFTGLLTHAGNTYNAKSLDKIKEIHSSSVEDLIQKKRRLEEDGFQDISLSIGDTPACSLADDFSGIDEIRPGNFVFYDLTQASLGVCSESDIAIGVASPVIAKHPERNEIVIYGGAIHLSKDMLILQSEEKIYGKIAKLSASGWSSTIPNAFVSSISQEHGVIKMGVSQIEKFQIGDIIVVIPIHSCLTANLFDHYYSLDGTLISNIHSK